MELKELFGSLRTIRRFTQEPVPEELIRDALECARTAPSAANLQPLYYIAVTSKENVAAMQGLVKWAAALPPELGTPKEGEQPTAFIVMVKRAGASAFSDADVGISARTITAVLWEQGFGSCMMGAINTKGIAELLGIPEEDAVRLVIAAGRPAHRSSVVDYDGESIKYYVDENVDYYVPKRAFDDVVRWA